MLLALDAFESEWCFGEVVVPKASKRVFAARDSACVVIPVLVDGVQSLWRARLECSLGNMAGPSPHSPSERWKNLSTLVRVESVRTIGTEQSCESRYYICSRAGISAEHALAAVRSHWGIENSLHWVLDVAFREDDSRVRAGNAAANFSAVRQLALGLLKQRTEAKVGIKIRRQRAGWDDDFLLRVIGLNA